MLKKVFKNLGPGTLVAAAFIGPGTVTLCTLAGVNFGVNLLWAMLLSIIATIFLQEMAARLGIVTQKGLAEVIREEIENPILNKTILILILAAIVVGNAAYEAGNIGGGILGLETIFGEVKVAFSSFSLNLLSFLVGLIAFVLLYAGNSKFLENALKILVLTMSVSFLVTAFVIQPDFLQIIRGFFLPNIPNGSILTIIGLIGTTIVPYNLFLHAALVKERWKKEEDIILAKKDTIISIALGGLVSIAIIITASAMQQTEIDNAADLAKSLVPLFGEFAKYFIALGIFAAGITSAITAPLATAYVVKGCLGWNVGLQSKKMRFVWISILCLGVFFSSINLKPILIIKFAQIANGILLPVIVGVLLWIINKKNVLGKFTNSAFQNVIGVCILITTIFLSAKGILKVFNLL